MSIAKLVLVSIILSFVFSIIFGLLFIPILKKLKFNQAVLEIGPKWHSGKKGTPTMGGLIFIASSLACLSCICLSGDNQWLASSKLFLLILGSVSFGVVGFLDDFIKVIAKRNLGLSVVQKFVLQFVAAALFVSCGMHMSLIDTQIRLPFCGDLLDLGFLYLPFALLVMIGGVNSVNFTDGLDGLASTVTTVVMVFFMGVAALVRDVSCEFFTSATIGALLGFLVYNFYPAKIFMGDTGSLFLGGVVCSIAILLKMPLILLIVGFVYVAETLSIMIQVISFKLTGKRIFKMSPIHHHFEMIGWNEKKIVLVFTLITAILCLITYKSINILSVS